MARTCCVLAATAHVSVSLLSFSKQVDFVVSVSVCKSFIVNDAE